MGPGHGAGTGGEHPGSDPGVAVPSAGPGDQVLTRAVRGCAPEAIPKHGHSTGVRFDPIFGGEGVRRGLAGGGATENSEDTGHTTDP